MSISFSTKVYVILVLLAVFSLAILFVAPAESDASGLALPLSGTGSLGSDLGTLIPGLDLSALQLPLLSPVTAPAPAQPVAGSGDPQTGAADSNGYGGYANGYTGASDLPAELGGADAGLATGGINSDGGIVPDWPATAADESDATAAGIVEPLGVRFAGIPLSLGSAGSAAPPEAGILGSMTDLSIPGFGTIRVGRYSTHSSGSQTQNEQTVLHVGIEAVGLNMQVPVGNSTSNVSRNGNKVDSSSTSTLLDLEPGAIFDPALAGTDSTRLQALDASSSSNANGTSAGNTNSWVLAGLKASGVSFLAVDSNNGLQLAGITVIPAPDSNSSLLAINQLEGLLGVYAGENWSQSDGKTYAFGGVNILRISVLGTPSFVVLGHAGSGANAVSATGPGAGPDQEIEGPPGSNIPPSEVSPPNDTPIVPVDRENPIGPGPDPIKPDDPNPNPNPLTPPTTATPAPGPDGPGLEPDPGFNWSVLPNTGIDFRIILAVAAGLFMLIAHGYKPAMTRLKNRAD